MDDLPVNEILSITAEHGVERVRVFGSRARGDAGSASDLDLLVDVRPGTTLLDLIQIKLDLEELLGMKVEVVTEGELHPRLRKRILAEAKPLVAA